MKKHISIAVALFLCGIVAGAAPQQHKVTSHSKVVVFCDGVNADRAAQDYPIGGASEKTPSHSEYFTWINNTNEGATHEQTLINLDFFRYLHEKYGMVLDIYAFDAGNIDGSKRYGTVKSDYYKAHFPEGFGPVSRFAGQDGTRLGIWCGPDGFGDTEAEAQERYDMMTSLVRDHNFGLFKMDAVCGQLRPEKYDWFTKMMSEIRKISPDFVLLNHRLDLGPGTKYSTTYLLGGAETYIDVHMGNDVTAPHHRVEALAREVPPTHLTEDHGVCLSSCLDYWDDDLILQTFNRNLILAPEIYGNPWLLRDDEFPKLAFIFNLHKDYRDILVDGISLPAEKYGLNAVSRGDGKTMFITDVESVLDMSQAGPVRYLRFERCPIRLAEITGYKDGVAVNGKHGENGAWAGFKIDGQYVGCPDRATSYRGQNDNCEFKINR